MILLIGVPSNTTVIWIHTRKNSRLAKNKFPIIFAVLDLTAILVALPLLPFIERSAGTDMERLLFHFTISVFQFAMNGYLTTLFLGTVDKFYAVMYPFKYRQKHGAFFKIALCMAFGWGLVFVTFVKIVKIGTDILRYIYAVYTAFIVLIFLSTITLYVVLIVKLIHTGRKFRGSGTSTTKYV